MDYYLLDSRRLWQVYLNHVKIAKDMKNPSATTKLINLMESSIAQNQSKKGIINSALEWISNVPFGKDAMRTDLFQDAFNRLDLYEQIIYYASFIDWLSNTNTRNHVKPQAVSFTAEIRLPTLLQSWGHCTIDINPETNTVKLNNKPIELKQYLVRKSKNSNRLIIVFEPIVSNVTPIRISFESTTKFQQCFIVLNLAMDNAHHEGYKRQEQLIKRSSSPMRPVRSSGRIDSSIKAPEKTYQIQCTLASSLEVFSMLMPNCQLHSLTQHDNTSFRIVSQSSKFKLSRSVTNNRMVKFMMIVRHPKELVAEVLSEPKQAYWNKEVTKCQIRQKDVEHNLGLIYQKLRGTNVVPLPRDFVILRHVFSYGNASFIIEKSISNSAIPNENGVIRGDMVFRLTWIQGQQPDFCWVTVLSQIHYKCGLPVESQVQMAESYLLQMLDLQSYIDRHKRGKTEFDLHWRQRVMPVSRLAELPASGQLHYHTRLLDSQILGSIRGSVAKTQISEVSLIKHLDNAFQSPAKDINFTNQLSAMSPIPCQFKASRKQRHPIWGSQWHISPLGLVCSDSQSIRRQNNYFKQMVLKLSTSDYYNLSIPTEISTQFSTLQLLAKALSMAPTLLEYATMLTDPVQRFKYAVCFGFSMGLLMIEANLPSRPLLGETYQGWIHGCPVYLEHIQTNPPVSSLLFKGRGYEISGTYTHRLDFEDNDLVSRCDSNISISFHNTHSRIELCLPRWRLQGIVSGERVFKYRECQTFLDESNQLYCQINYGQGTREWAYEDAVPVQGLSGSISMVSSSFVQKYKKAKNSKPAANQLIKSISRVSGKWTEYLQFDDKVYYNVSEQLPSLVVNEQHPLPSDSSMRQDLQALSKKDWQLAAKNRKSTELLEKEDCQRRKQK